MPALEGGAALPVTTGGSGEAEERAAVPVYVVSGNSPVIGQRARRVVVVTSGPVDGGAAQPVYDMGVGALSDGDLALPVYVVPGGGSLSGGGGVARTLVFSDEFPGASLDLAKWVAVPPGNGNGANGYEAGELQANIASAITVGSGLMTITATKVNPPGPQVGGKDYTSGCPSTYGIFSKSYGRFEIRAKVPNGGGQWPAFWLYPADPTLNQSAVLVPEIDIFEFFQGDKLVHCNYFDAQHLAHQSSINLGDLSLGFHTYAVEWSENKIEWFVDDVSVFSTPYQVASQRMYVVVQFSLGGNGGTISDAALPSTFVPDYVKVWETLDAFHPGQIGGLQMWWDAERQRSLSSYYAPGATDYTDGASMDRWYDRSGWGNDRSPLHGTVANQPIFRTNGPNGLAYVHFDGVNDFLGRTAAVWPLHIGTGSFAFGAFVRCDNVSGVGVYKCIFDYGQNGINSPGFYIVNGKPVVSTGNADFIFATTLSSNTWYFLYWERETGTNNLNCWVNGALDANTLTFNRNVPDVAYAIGNDNTTSWWNGDNLGMVFYNALPTAAERTKLFTYYGSRTGIF